MESEGSLPRSQVPATCPYPEPLLMLSQTINSSPRPCEMLRKVVFFLRWAVVSTSPNPPAGGSPFVGCPRPCEMLRKVVFFYGEQLLAPRQTPQLEDHPLSAVRGFLFNTFAATRHFGGRSSIRRLMKSQPWWRSAYAYKTVNVISCVDGN